LNIPHNERRFPGSKKDPDSGEWTYSPEIHKKYIFGGHVAAYLESLKDDEEVLNRQFGKYVAAGIKPKDIESMYKKAHAAIRADPNKKRDPKEKGSFGKSEKPKEENKKFEKKHFKTRPTSLTQKRGRVKQILLAKKKTNVTTIKTSA